MGMLRQVEELLFACSDTVLAILHQRKKQNMRCRRLMAHCNVKSALRAPNVDNLCLPSSRCRSAEEEKVVGVVSRVASLPSLSGNRPVSRWPAGEHARRLSALLPSFSFHPQLPLPSKSNFLSREIPLAGFFLILGAIYFQNHANYKLHNIAHEIGSQFTKSSIC